jgi:hypothetical protein
MGACASAPRYPHDYADEAVDQLPSLGRTRASDDRRLLVQSSYERRREAAESEMVRVRLVYSQDGAERAAADEHRRARREHLCPRAGVPRDGADGSTSTMIDDEDERIHPRLSLDAFVVIYHCSGIKNNVETAIRHVRHVARGGDVVRAATTARRSLLSPSPWLWTWTSARRCRRARR